MGEYPPNPFNSNTSMKFSSCRLLSVTSAVLQVSRQAVFAIDLFPALVICCCVLRLVVLFACGVSSFLFWCIQDRPHSGQLKI